MKKIAILCFILSFNLFGGEKKVYKKPSEEEIKKKLTDLQYKVTQKDGTERAFQNEYWDNKREGIYVDIVSGEPLFSSKHKYKSGTGWPSFYQPLVKENIVTKKDRKFFMVRTEVRSKHGDSHLGHVFEDGPQPTGLRYCMNSAAMRFIPKEDLKKEGYEEFLSHFEDEKKSEGREVNSQNIEVAVVAGGCFWGVEHLFSKLDGVIDVKSGYTGGQTDNPGYKQISTGKTGHAEAVEIKFNPSKISYETILKYFFRLHDPTTKDRQGWDTGSQYRSAIFYQNEDQKKIAQKVIELVDKSNFWGAKAVTELNPAAKFWDAEDYHQNYYVKKYEGVQEGRICHTLRPDFFKNLEDKK